MRKILPGILRGSLLLLVLSACGEEPPAMRDRAAEGGMALARDYSAAVSEEDARVRLESLRGLEDRLEALIAEDRIARLILLRTLDAESAAARALGDGQEEIRAARRFDRLSERFLTMDPADGRLRGYLVSRATEKQDFSQVWRLLDGSAATVDLDTVDPLIRAAASLMAFRVTRPELAARAREWLLPFYETLIERSRGDLGRRELLERLLCEKGLVLLARNRREEAEKVLRELEALGPPGSQYFRLETALESR